MTDSFRESVLGPEGCRGAWEDEFPGCKCGRQFVEK